jgi:hypothetical protein
MMVDLIKWFLIESIINVIIEGSIN